MGEFTGRAGIRGRRHGDPESPLVPVQRALLSVAPGATRGGVPERETLALSARSSCFIVPTVSASVKFFPHLLF